MLACTGRLRPVFLTSMSGGGAHAAHDDDDDDDDGNAPLIPAAPRDETPMEMAALRMDRPHRRPLEDPLVSPAN